MKKLKVPYLETLDVLDLSSVGFLMEKAQRESIDVINWEEYSLFIKNLEKKWEFFDKTTKTLAYIQNTGIISRKKKYLCSG